MAHTALVAGFTSYKDWQRHDEGFYFYYHLTYIILIGLMNDLRLVNLHLGKSPELAMAERCLWRLCFPIVKDEKRSLAYPYCVVDFYLHPHYV
jgi:hypothetical protein